MIRPAHLRLALLVATGASPVLGSCRPHAADGASWQDGVLAVAPRAPTRATLEPGYVSKMLREDPLAYFDFRGLPAPRRAPGALTGTVSATVTLGEGGASTQATGSFALPLDDLTLTEDGMSLANEPSDWNNACGL
jgi:hypothetical protein